jgi:hypothetical protein
MTSDRTTDLAVLLGHAFQCEECRSRLLAEPDRVIVGRKLTSEQRERLLKLTAQDFGSAQMLASATGISSAELIEGVNHPRARLRHL